MDLRPYQQDIKNKIYRSWKEHRAVMATMPTGAGKTVLFCSIAKDCVDRGGRVLILAHREELITQAANKISGLGLETGIIKSGYTAEYYKRVQVASVQTLIRREVPYKFNLCIVDEAHHDQHDNAYGSIRKRLTEANPDMFTLGVTATPVRLNGSGFKDIYDILVKGITVKELIRQGFLSPPKYMTFPYVHLGKVKKTGGDFNLKDLSEKFRSKIPAEFLVNDYLRLAKGKQTIVFAIDVAHSKEIEAAYMNAGIRCAHIDGETPDRERQSIIRNFANKSIQVVTNVGVFTEGYDCPGIEAVQLARPTESLSLYMQMSGRGLRPADGKENCLILDRANCIATHGLLESDRDWELGKSSGQKSKNKIVAVDTSTGKQYDIEYLPQDINPEYIVLKELDTSMLNRMMMETALAKSFLRMKYLAESRNFKHKWIWYKLIAQAKNSDEAEFISQLYVKEYQYKPGMVKFLMEEYRNLKKAG